MFIAWCKISHSLYFCSYTKNTNNISTLFILSLSACMCEKEEKKNHLFTHFLLISPSYLSTSLSISLNYIPQEPALSLSLTLTMHWLYCAPSIICKDSLVFSVIRSFLPYLIAFSDLCLYVTLCFKKQILHILILQIKFLSFNCICKDA